MYKHFAPSITGTTALSVQLIRKVICFALFSLSFVFSGYGQFTDVDSTSLDTSLLDLGIKDPATLVYENTAAGEFTPGKGFQIVKNDFASLNISMYAMARWVNQISPDKYWEDHKGDTVLFDGRNDIYWHRVMIWLTGYVATPKLTYMATVWTVTSTQQTLVYGNLKYTFSPKLTFGIGITPNVCIRSIQGPFPYYASTDRTMAEEALRGGFTNGVFITGELFPRFRYTAALGNNLSILGVKAANLTRHYSKSISFAWMPTTGEFGPRGGNGDLEYHEKLATRFGISLCHSRENKFNNVDIPTPDNTQVRLSDGLLFFETGALAHGVTVIEADYDMAAVDIGFKYKGWALHTEFYYRTLSKIDADGEIPIDFINDNGYTAQLLYMAVPKKLCLYAVNSMLFDEFDRNPYEIGGGFNYYPSKTRSWRINAQVMAITKGAGGGTFGLYTAGQTGTTITIGTDILL